MNNKIAIVDAIIQQLKLRLNAAVEAANQAHETATHSEAVARSKYETFGLEASYLAHGQTRRVEECEGDLKSFTSLHLLTFDEHSSIGLSSMVTLEDAKGVSRCCFIGPGGGGVKIQLTGVLHCEKTIHKSTIHNSTINNSINNDDINGDSNGTISNTVTVITPSSPLGQKLIGRCLGDVFTLQLGDHQVEYEIIGLN